jgi:predicted aspartyl protease
MRASVSFDFAGPGRPLIVVPTMVNERGPYRFVLDTGAGHCLVAPRVAAALALTAGTRQEALGAGGKVVIAMTRVATLAVAGARATNVEIGITEELTAVSTAVGSPLDGDLGYNFLKAFRLTVDYAARVLHLASRDNGDNLPPPDRGHTIPFTLASVAKPLILVDAFANHRGPLRFVVDTGASTTVLSTQVVQELGLATQPAAALTGGGGAVPVSLGHLDVLRIGLVSVPRVTVAIADFLTPLGERVGVRLDGIIGHNILKEFRPTIDYPRSVLQLE